MNGKNLLLGLSYISRKYIEESEQDFPLRKPDVSDSAGRPVPSKVPPKGKIWLIAAAVALTLLLVGCAVVVYSRIQMKVVQHHVPTAAAPAEAAMNAPAQQTPPAKDPLTCFYPQTLPAGYQMGEGYPLSYHTRGIDYRNADGKIIFFRISTYEPIEIILAPPAEKTTTTVSGYAAVMQVSENGGQSVAWHNESEGYYANFFTEDMAVDLSALAESVDCGPAIPLSFLCRDGELWNVWYPQQLPEGYSCEGVSPFSGGMQFVDYTNAGERIVYGISLTANFEEDAAPPPHDPYTWEDLTVAGQPARMLTTSEQQILYWQNKQERFYAMLSVSDHAVDILALAESVAPGVPLAVSSHYLGPDYTIELEQNKSTYIGWEPVYPQWVPEGFEISFVSDPAYGQQTIRYEDAAGRLINYELYFRLGQWGRQFDGMGQPDEVTVNGNPGYRLGNSLIWTDAAKGFGFVLDCGDGVDLMAIAESVGIGPELEPTNADKTQKALAELGDYRITQLPGEMEEDSVTGMPLEDGDGWYSYVRRWYVNPNTNAQVYFEYETYAADPPISAKELVQIYLGDRPTEFCTIQNSTGATSQGDSDANVVWVLENGKQGVRFKLFSSDYTAPELLTMAESVQKK